MGLWGYVEELIKDTEIIPLRVSILVQKGTILNHEITKSIKIGNLEYILKGEFQNFLESILKNKLDY